MNDLFLGLLLISLIGLVIGLVKPSWVKQNGRKRVLMIFGGGFILFFILFGVTSNSTPKEVSDQSAKEEATITPEISQAAQPQEVQKNIPKATSTPVPVSNETVSQKNAVAKAKSYLAYTAFSHDGLVTQLEYEQFSHADAVYGADNSGADWNEQAAKKAKAYMSYSAFSRGSLITQLEYDKFTQAQAEYGADAVGL